MNIKADTIPVFFSIDDNYAPYLGVALHSAVEHASPDRHYLAIVLYEELSLTNKMRLLSMTKENFGIRFVRIDQQYEGLSDRMGNRLRADYFTMTIFFRLFIPSMFPEYDKGIYLDSDIVVLEDLAKLYDQDLQGNIIGAVHDSSVVDVPPLVRYIEEAVGVSRYRYINSGILLMDMKKMRENQFEQHFLRLLNTYHFDCIAPDQDYLNAMCRDHILYLSPDWDVMPVEGRPPVKNPKLVHYNLFSKPWCYDGVQYEEYFWKYAEETEYYSEIRWMRDHYSDRDKQSDKEAMERMIRQGLMIAESEVTFKNIFGSGKEERLWVR
ncbi:MAG: glycosyltransferase family 8 protein [Anaerovoracaceae bacterium]